MTDPHGDTLFGEVSCAVQNVFVGMAGEFFVLLIINMLDVQHDKIGIFQ